MTGRQEKDLQIEHAILNKIYGRSECLMAYYYAKKRKLSIRTLRQYITTIVSFLDWCGKPVNKIVQLDVSKYIDRIGDDSSGYEGRRGAYAALKSFFDYASTTIADAETGSTYIKFNPMNGYEKPAAEPKNVMEERTDALSVPELRQLFRNIFAKDGCILAPRGRRKWYWRNMAMVTLMLNTAMRASALLELNVSDLDFENKKITFRTKGRPMKVMSFEGLDFCFEFIENWLEVRKTIPNSEKTDALFLSSKKNRLSIKALSELCGSYEENIEKHLHPHIFRSTVSTYLFNKGVDYEIIGRFMGHSPRTITGLYIRDQGDKINECVKMLDNMLREVSKIR